MVKLITRVHPKSSYNLHLDRALEQPRSWWSPRSRGEWSKSSSESGDKQSDASCNELGRGEASWTLLCENIENDAMEYGHRNSWFTKNGDFLKLYQFTRGMFMTCHPHLKNPGSMVWANSGTWLKPPANIHNLSELTQLTFAILTIGADSETWETTRFVGDCPNMVRILMVDIPVCLDTSILPSC